jgi:hypothetical protein
MPMFPNEDPSILNVEEYPKGGDEMDQPLDCHQIVGALLGGHREVTSPPLFVAA